MTRSVPDTLRARLRRDTEAAHDRLDAMLSTLDLTSRSGLRRYLLSQFVALRALETTSNRSRSAELTADLIGRALQDLQDLGMDASDELPKLDFEPDPLAVDYMVTGSRLGTAVLKRRWLEATDPVVRSTRAYFSAPDHVDHWRAFQSEAESRDANGPAADRAVMDANRLFDFFSDCAAFAMAQTATESQPDMAARNPTLG